MYNWQVINGRIVQSALHTTTCLRRAHLVTGLMLVPAAAQKAVELLWLDMDHRSTIFVHGRISWYAHINAHGECDAYTNDPLVGIQCTCRDEFPMP